MARSDSFKNLSYYFHKYVCRTVYKIHSVISSMFFNIYAITSKSYKGKNSIGYGVVTDSFFPI